MGYWNGLVEGFQAKREAEFFKNYQMEQQNRQLADRVYQHLLASRDPQMQELALSGLASPIGKKKGLAGFLGGVESNPVMAQIAARMNEMVPDPGRGGGPAPPAPGSAAMSTNQPVRAGSVPLGGMLGSPLPPEAAPPGVEAAPSAAGGPTAPAATTTGPPPLGPTPGSPSLLGTPPPPMESPLKRRGTGVPTAEEVAEMQARVPLETKIQVATQQLTQAGATPDEIQQAIMGMLGAPQNLRQFSAPTFAVKNPATGQPVPVAFDHSSGKFFFTDGTPVPANAEFVRMAGAAGGSLTSSIRDTPEARAQLIEMGADPSILMGGSPTGYWRFQQRLDGSVLVQPGEYTPPPAFAGTGTILDAGNNPTLVGIPRQGGAPVVLGSGVSPQPTEGNAAAQALLDVVKQRIAAAETPRLPRLPKRVLQPAQLDQIVQQAATEAGLPYQTFFELQQAVRLPAARQVAPRTEAPAAAPGATKPPLSTADRIRQRALENRARGGAGSPPPPARPTAPPARSRGAGPRQ